MASNVHQIGDALDRAIDLTPAPAARAPDDDDGGTARRILPPDCPVQALGKLGQVCWFLDEMGQLTGLSPRDWGKGHIVGLFGRATKALEDIWPRYGAPKKDEATGEKYFPVVGFDQPQAQETLMLAAATAGIFDPQGRVKGRGAHRGEGGELVLHCGDQVMIRGASEMTWTHPGVIGGLVFPTGPAGPRPAAKPADGTAAAQLLALISTWNWQRGDTDAYLLLGWIGQALVGGALDWRSHAWVTGDSSTGKSTLQALIDAVFNKGALSTGDATPASLRQLLQQQTLPVLFDEIEASEDDRRAKGVIELARLASSGAVVYRGSQDNSKASEFLVRSAFLFSSILMPPMLNQDRNRLAILELNTLKPGAVPPTVDLALWRSWGADLRRRLVDQWDRWPETLQLYCAALAAEGHSSRGQSQFGTMLAAADLLLYDVASAEHVYAWAARLRASSLAEKAGEESDSDQAAAYLASTKLHSRGGDEPETVARAIRKAMRDDSDVRRERLKAAGLRVVRVKRNGEEPDGQPRYGASDWAGGHDAYLAVANSHRGLDELFRDSRWKLGVWSQSFGRVAGAIKRVKVGFDGKPLWATLVPIEAVIGPVEIEAP